MCIIGILFEISNILFFHLKIILYILLSILTLVVILYGYLYFDTKLTVIINDEEIVFVTGKNKEIVSWEDIKSITIDNYKNIYLYIGEEEIPDFIISSGMDKIDTLISELSVYCKQKEINLKVKFF